MKQIIIKEQQLQTFIDTKKTHLRIIVENFGRPNVILKQIKFQNVQFLKEELGIDQDTAGYAFHFTQQLIELYYSHSITPNMIEYDSVGREYVEIIGNFQLFDRETSLTFIIINFENQEDFWENVKNYNIGASFDPHESSYEIVCPAINWQLDTSILQPMLHHEMVHNYQTYKMQRNDLFNDKDRLLYNKAWSERNKDDEFTNACSEVIYLSNKVEISAYANQLYSELISNAQFLKANKEQQINIALQGEVGYTLSYFKYCIQILQNQTQSKEAQDYCLRTYNMPLDNLIKKGENYYRYFQKRFGKALLKAIKDLEIENS